MLILMAGRASVPIVSGAPILGFNWDQGKSISAPEDTSYTGGAITKFGSGGEIAGYTQGIRVTNGTVALSKPAALQTIGLQDFTAEGWFWLSAVPNYYHPVFQLKWPNIGDIFVQFGDSGFDNRLQTGLRAAFGNDQVYNTSYTREMFVSKWHHIALVRKDRKVKLYIDGVLQSLAIGTTSNYNTTEMPGDVDFQGAVSLCQLSSAVAAPSDLFCPEFLLTLSAKYTANFTPPVGPIYK